MLKQVLGTLLKNVARATTSLPGTSATFGVPRGFNTYTSEWFKTGISNVGSLYTELSKASEASRKLPAYVDMPLQEKVQSSLTGKNLPRFVASLNRGRYFGSCFGVVLNPDDTLLQDVSLNSEDWCREVTGRDQHNAFQRFPSRLKTHVKGELLCLSTPFASNYHHFLLDTIPRLGLCEEAGIDYKNVQRIITEYNGSIFQKEILSKLGINLGLMQNTTGRLHVQADMLYAPSISEPVCRESYINYTIEGMEFVRRKLRPALDRSKKRRILLSRRLANSRRWIEEEEALPELEKLGFVRVECESLTVTEQARIFGEAEAIIMPHGGGMANCVFCEPGTKVFELFNPTYNPVFMLSLSTLLGINYHAVSGPMNRELSPSIKVPSAVEVSIAPARMLKILKTFL